MTLFNVIWTSDGCLIKINYLVFLLANTEPYFDWSMSYKFYGCKMDIETMSNA